VAVEGDAVPTRQRQHSGQLDNVGLPCGDRSGGIAAIGGTRGVYHVVTGVRLRDLHIDPLWGQ